MPAKYYLELTFLSFACLCLIYQDHYVIEKPLPSSSIFQFQSKNLTQFNTKEVCQEFSFEWHTSCEIICLTAYCLGKTFFGVDKLKLKSCSTGLK